MEAPSAPRPSCFWGMCLGQVDFSTTRLGPEWDGEATSAVCGQQADRGGRGGEAYRADRPVLGRGAQRGRKWKRKDRKEGRKERKRKRGDILQLTADFWLDFWS